MNRRYREIFNTMEPIDDRNHRKFIIRKIIWFENNLFYDLFKNMTYIWFVIYDKLISKIRLDSLIYDAILYIKSIGL